VELVVGSWKSGVKIKDKKKQNASHESYHESVLIFLIRYTILLPFRGRCHRQRGLIN